MSHAISRESRRELIEAVGDRYRTGRRAEKRRILDEFVAVTGWHRKHAIRALSREGAVASDRRVRVPRLYDEAVRQALLVLWEASDRVCSKRLKALIPTMLDALERHGHLEVAVDVRPRLLAVSAATIDRLLAAPRAVARGAMPRHSRGAKSVRRSVPVRTSADWKDPTPGSMEADLVCHCGSSMEGAFVSTLVLTDVASTWTECIPLIARDAWIVTEALDRLRVSMPFPLSGLDTDNGSEFINAVLIEFCSQHAIEQTRSRPYRKNDQAFVEQKNGAVVRRLVGYGRLQGVVAVEALARLYAASRLFVNFFQPSFKLAEKTRHGARTTKRYHAPATPAARLLDSSTVTAATKERLREVQAALDPLRLLDEIRAAQGQIAAFVAGERTPPTPMSDPDLESFLAGLSTAWRAGEVRPTHMPKPRAIRHWRTRRDPLEDVWPLIERWLEAEPDRTATDLLARLRNDGDADIGDEVLRTLQRRVRRWRQIAAKNLVLGGGLALFGARDHAGG